MFNGRQEKTIDIGSVLNKNDAYLLYDKKQIAPQIQVSFNGGEFFAVENEFVYDKEGEYGVKFKFETSQGEMEFYERLSVRVGEGI